MNNINNKLTENQKIFFDNMSNYIDEKLYFFGSILRPDYIKGKSDIDVEVFTDNESSTMNKLINFLNLKKSKIKKTILKTKSKMVYGYKVKYEDLTKEIDVEIVVYNNNDKDLVLGDVSNNIILPFYITTLLIIIKFFYYTLGILPKRYYRYCKQFLMRNDGEENFIVVDND